MIYGEVTEKIIGSAMQVHNTLGLGFHEIIYQRALAIEMQSRNINFEREKKLIVYYKEKEIGSNRVDFLVKSTVIVEIKAVQDLDEVHYLQVINYLEAFKLNIGLLINFGARSLQFKRIYNNKNQGNPSNPINQG